MESTYQYPEITRTQIESYHQNGYLVIKNGLSSDEIDELRQETIRICRGEAGDFFGSKHVEKNEAEAKLLSKYVCIHYPHKLSSTIHKYLAHPAIVNVLTKVIGPNVKCMQSMLFIKASGKPGQAWHQDEDFIPTRDRSLTAGWIALDDAVVDNGCLWVIPGSHRQGVLWPLHVQNNSELYGCSEESGGFPYSDRDAIPVEVPAGSIVFFNGYLLHKSLPNRTQSSYRRVLVNHYMSAASLLPWRRPEEGEKMGTADFRDIVIVAGNDPYHYKGIENLNAPYVRPDGEGGCDSQVKKIRSIQAVN